MEHRIKIKDFPLLSFRFLSARERREERRYGRDFQVGGCRLLAKEMDELRRLPVEFLNVRHLLGAQEGIVVSGGGYALEFAFSEWAEHRMVPMNRRHSGAILSELGAKGRYFEDIVRTSSALSLTDSYWVVSEDDAKRWGETNLFENPFDLELFLAARDGYAFSRYETAEGRLSPEPTTDGMLRKVWRRDGGQILLCKGRGRGLGLEPYSEFLAAQVAERMGLSHVRYDLEIWHGEIVSVCPLMTSPERALVSYWQMMDRFGGAEDEKLSLEMDDVLWAAERVGCLDALADMLVFDAVILNMDRHHGNFGFIRDSSTGILTQFAPLYDHGLSLLSELPWSSDVDWKLEVERLRMKRHALCPLSFEELFREFAGPLQYERLRRLEGFELSLPEKFMDDEMAFPKERLRALNAALRDNVECYIKMDPRRAGPHCKMDII